ncbi:MAG: aldehyde dehydrogenase family protein [Acidimicrobiales bacterium]
MRAARVAGRLITSGRPMEVVNPYDGAAVAEVASLRPVHVEQACAGARRAMTGDRFPLHVRVRVLERAAVELERPERSEAFARTIALEAGKPIRTARAEVARCAETLRFAAAEARGLAGEMVAVDASPPGAGKLAFALRVPRGVVAAITPFNFPLNLVAHKLAPAIAAGAAVVLKPAPATPLSALDLVDLLVECGMPEDWVSVVTGPGADLGEALVGDPVPAVVSFTGSAEVGWSLPARAGRKRVLLELGSSSPVVVEPDADLGRVVSKVEVAGFSYAGQSCISTQRVLASREVAAELTDRLKVAVEALVVGDPLREETDVGPLISLAAAERVGGLVREAVAAGALLVTGGTSSGALMWPTVLSDVKADDAVCAREVFGPVVAVMAYDGFEEGLRLAGQGDGIHAGVFTNDLAKALGAARSLDFGGVLVNEVPTFRADQQPYGGVGMSGNTREGPRYAIEEMTALRFVSLQA